MNENELSQELQTLWGHQDLLSLVLITARERVVIVSPYISSEAITSDCIDELVKQAVERGVRVQVFVDYQRNCYSNGAMKGRALDGIATLVEAGAQVGVCNGIQRKILLRDYDLIAEGAFNWLSAILIRNGERQLEVVTKVYCGETAAQMIFRELAMLEETEYEFATIKENSGIEVTRAGKVFCLCSVLIILFLALKPATDKTGAIAFLVIIICVALGSYRLRGRGAGSKESVPQMQ